MFPYIALSKDKTWQPGPYEGVELMILHTHENTGGVVVLRKFKAGYTIPAHTHPDANEWAYVLSGEWEESDIVYTAGSLFFAPKGVRHGPHVARTEVISLTIFDGAADRCMKRNEISLTRIKMFRCAPVSASRFEVRRSDRRSDCTQVSCALHWRTVPDTVCLVPPRRLCRG